MNILNKSGLDLERKKWMEKENQLREVQRNIGFGDMSKIQFLDMEIDVGGLSLVKMAEVIKLKQDFKNHQILRRHLNRLFSKFNSL